MYVGDDEERNKTAIWILEGYGEGPGLGQYQDKYK